jgi:transcriptional regulator with PAS, ATPase and Fis domain
MASKRPTPPSTTVRTLGGGGSTANVLLVAGPTGLVTCNLVGELVLGRDPTCDIPLDSPKISRRHARVVAGPPITVQDLGSTNGVRVRGTKHVGGEPVEIATGDAFQLGPFSVLLLPADEDGTPANEARAHLTVKHPTVKGVHPTVERIALSEINVLIQGETGAGKEVLARTVHQLSRRTGPFLALNCAAVHEGLLESELFGHERGAFTGAIRDKPGLLESAAGGTVFLDEIGDLPAAIQAKLLRVLEAREVIRIGSVTTIALDVRFVAATHRALREEIARGAFREDLYYRLNGVTLVVPPLRERRGTILGLAHQLLADAAARSKRSPVPTLSVAAAEALRAHPWPGNVRELRAVLERALLLAEGEELRPEHLVLEQPIASATTDTGSALSPTETAERDKIMAALEAAAGNQTRAAKTLGISRATLVNKLAIYRIARPRSR